MSKTEREYREDIVEIGRLMFQKSWIAANDGNVTIRLDEQRILATPTGLCKGMMRVNDIVIVDSCGAKLSGSRDPTTEIAMHLKIYELRPDVNAVVHAHPPVATGFAAAGRALNIAVLPEVVVGLGSVPLAAYGLPGTPALTEPMIPLIAGHDALLMANHGAVCYGDDVYQAYFRMETVEHFARILLVAELLGGPNALPRREVDKLFDSRPRYGVKTQQSGPSDCLLTAEDLKSPDPGRASNAGRSPVTREELALIVEDLLRVKGLV